MDYHFLRPKLKQNSPSFNQGNLSRVVAKFLPVFVLAAMLPFLIGVVISPPDVGFFTRADNKEELRIWLEPANVVMNKGSVATFTVVASFDSDTKLIPEISLEVLADAYVEVDNPALTYKVPFSGRVELGTVTLTALEPGKARLSIPENSIKITAGPEPLEITTGSSNVVIR